jgi:hypothetical protein
MDSTENYADFNKKIVGFAGFMGCLQKKGHADRAAVPLLIICFSKQRITVKSE